MKKNDENITFIINLYYYLAAYSRDCSFNKPASRSVYGKMNLVIAQLHRIHHNMLQKLCHCVAQYVTSCSCVFDLHDFCVLLFIATAKIHVPYVGRVQ